MNKKDQHFFPFIFKRVSSYLGLKKQLKKKTLDVRVWHTKKKGIPHKKVGIPHKKQVSDF